jgi:hypothetical protein
MLKLAKAEALKDQRTILGAAATKLTMGRARIVAILPRGEALRNFVYSEALDEIARSAEVTVLSVIPNGEFREILRARYPNVLPLRASEDRWVVQILREILDMSHGRWLWSEAARERWRLRSVEAVTPAQKLKLGIKRLACYPFANRRGLEMLSRVECVTSRWLSSADEYIQLFKELKPSLVFNSSHVHSRVAIQAVQAARALDIPTATFIFSWDNLTSQGRIIPPYDYYLVWSEAIKDQLLSIYSAVRPEQIFVTGTPQFDFHFRPEFYWSREEFCQKVGADPARPIVLYSTGMANHMPGETHLVESVAAMLREMTDLGPPQLMVRVYPKDRTGRFEEVKRKLSDVLFPTVPWEPVWLTPHIEDIPLLTNTLRHCAAGINVASTISLELCMFDKPVINIGYNPPGVATGEVDYANYYNFDHYRPVVASGAVTLAESETDVKLMLRRALVNPTMGSAQRRALIKKMFGETLDGCSGARVARRLVDLASRRGPI